MNRSPWRHGKHHTSATSWTWAWWASATATIAVILPAIIFFLAQRQFTQGIVMTGVEK